MVDGKPKDEVIGSQGSIPDEKGDYNILVPCKVNEVDGNTYYNHEISFCMSKLGNHINIFIGGKDNPFMATIQKEQMQKVLDGVFPKGFVGYLKPKIKQVKKD